MNIMTESEIKYIIERVLDNSKDALMEARENPDEDFYKGKKLAYYEVLDTIKNELTARIDDLKEFGLDIDLDKMFS